jgi:hypothetical protein
MKRFVLAVLTLAILVLPVLVTPVHGQNSGISNTTIKITSPEKNAKVSANEMIEGTSQNIPEGNRFWIAVYPRSVNRYYFQDFSPNFMPNGDWSNNAVIGDRMSSGQKFDIYVVLADGEANKLIENHLAECRARQSWPGLEKLPEGTTLFDKVMVIRE